MKLSYVAACAVAVALATPALADDYTITLKDNQFTPKELNIPAGQKVSIVVKNENPKAAEFESEDLGREKVVPANGQVTIKVGPVDAGSYGYENDFDKTAKGTIVAK